MPIPQTSDFDAALAGLTLSPPETEGFDSITALDEQVLTEAAPSVEGFARGDTFRVLRQAATRLWFRSDTRVSFDALLRRVVTELNARRHVATSPGALALLAVFAALKSETGSAAKQLNRLLDCIHGTQVTQFVRFPGMPPDEFCLQLPSFELGKLDWPRLTGLCERAGTDFHRRYGGRFEGSFGLRRESFEASVCDFADYGRRYLSNAAASRLQPGSPGYGLIDAYYNVVARHFVAELWEALLAEQHVLLAAGAPYLDERALKNLPGQECVTVFFWASPAGGQHGWVSPTVHAQMYLELGKSDVKVRSIREFLENRFAITATDATSLGPAVSSYVRFLSRAARHGHDGRADESFVHFVIALDLLLGSADASAKSVSERAAVIVFQAMGLTFDEAVTRLRGIYGARSKYVHEGRGIPDTSLREVERVAREVLFALLRIAAARTNAVAPEMAERWLKELDLCVASLNAGRPIAAADWKAAGIELATSE